MRGCFRRTTAATVWGICSRRPCSDAFRRVSALGGSVVQTEQSAGQRRRTASAMCGGTYRLRRAVGSSSERYGRDRSRGTVRPFCRRQPPTNPRSRQKISLVLLFLPSMFYQIFAGLEVATYPPRPAYEQLRRQWLLIDVTMCLSAFSPHSG